MGLNVYEDLGFPDANAMFLKAGLMHQIQCAIEVQGMGRVQAAQAIGIEPATLGTYLRGGFHDVTIETLVSYLNRLGQDVEIVVSPSLNERGEPARTMVRGSLQANVAA